MTYAEQMLETMPNKSAVDMGALVECSDACFACAQACTACADDCIREHNVQMLERCIGLNLDCADLCSTTGRLSSCQTSGSRHWSARR